MKDIKIVTAFFDIDRGNSEYINLRRSVETYFDYFKFWARIQNDLIVYCALEHIGKIKKIREDFGRFNTTIIPVGNIYGIEPFLFNRMLDVENDPVFHTFRQRKVIENTAKYDYIMLLKAWCLQDAAQRINEDCNLAWIDFGYNHGDSFYTDSSDFDFYWKWDFPEKISILGSKNPAEASVVDLLHSVLEVLRGSLIVIPKHMASSLLAIIKSRLFISRSMPSSVTNFSPAFA